LNILLPKSYLSRACNTLEKYALSNVIDKIPLSDEDSLVREKCESSFYEFVKHAWIHVDGRDYVDGWHIQAMCEHLQALYKMDIKNLLCNLPPRMGKSTIFSVMFPAWCWIIDPGLRFFYISYSEKLTLRDSIYCRRLIGSNWYRKFWSDKFSILRNVDNMHVFHNNKHGYRIASSIGGTITGEGADFVFFDDPNDVETVHSDVVRNGTNDFLDFKLSSRYSRIKLLRKGVTQQRTHTDDVSGHILAKNDPRWIHLCLPMEFESSRRSMTIPLPMSNGKQWADPRKKDGELLWPHEMGPEELKGLKLDFRNDSYRISSQLQQRPSPIEGGVIKADWFNKWTHSFYPDFEYILQSWDTALTDGELSCYSACTTWGVFKNEENGYMNIMLLSLFREKILYPELRKVAMRLSKNYEDVYLDEPTEGRNPPHHILIEEKVSGYCLFQELIRAGLPVIKFNPNPHGNKLWRCMMVTHLIENGLVWLPTEPPAYKHYTQDSQMFLEAAINFPEKKTGNPTNDIIDTMSQAFTRLLSFGWVSNTYDPSYEREHNWKGIRNKYGNP
jgi:phage terminase large subunit-like protein